jgi:ferrochelatase
MSGKDVIKAHVTSSKVGVLLVNLGTPEAPTAAAVRKYLKQFLSDSRVVEIPKFIWWFILNLIILPIRSGASAKKYKSIWTKDGSPLFVYSRTQAELLAKKFAKSDSAVVVDLAMRYGQPSIESVIHKLTDAGVDRLLVLPLYPQYSATTTASTSDEIFRVMSKQRNQVGLRMVKHYHDHPGYIEALKQKVEAYWAEHGRPNFAAGDRFLMSFHGIPRRSLDLGDPYHCECFKTGRLLREALGLSDKEAITTFQSRFGKAEWLKPYTAVMVEALAKAGVQRLDVFCPGFPADCLETLEEIAMEAQEIFHHAGGQTYHAIPCLNESSAWIDALEVIALENLQGWDLKLTSEEVLARRAEIVSRVSTT